MIDSQMGTGPQILDGQSSGSACAYGPDVFQSPLLDLTTSYANVEILPARPGYYPLVISASWIIESASGTQTTPPTFQAGNDAAHTNILINQSTTPSNANVNAAAAPCRAGFATTNTSAATKRIAGSTVYFDLTVPATGTGGYSCKAKLSLLVFWIPFGAT